jgi:hypothetical protein
MHLPSRQDLPDYYKHIARPLSLYTVKERIRSGVLYTSWSRKSPSFPNPFRRCFGFVACPFANAAKPEGA